MKELESILQQQEQNLHHFYEMMIIKQKNLIDQDFEGLQESLLSEEKILKSVDEQNGKLTSMIKDLSEKFSLNLKSNRLSEFMEAVNDQADINIKVIYQLKNSLTELTYKCEKLNYQNQVLIEHSRNFIKETITNLFAMNNNKILDQKV